MSDHPPAQSENPGLLGTLIKRWRSEGFDSAQYADELEDALATLPQQDIQPTDQPHDHRGEGRLLLNEYGRKCWHAGRRSALDESAALPPAPPQAQEPRVAELRRRYEEWEQDDMPEEVTNTLLNDMWNALQLVASPPAQAQELHRDCHDLVCNGNRNYPRGEPGHSCSCRSRDLRNAALPPAHGWQPAIDRVRRAIDAYDAEQLRLFGPVKITHAGRAGRELQEVIDAARDLPAPPVARPTEQP